MMNNRVLLIDDDPEDHEIFEFALDLVFPEAVCEHSFNCQDAVEKLRNNTSYAPDNIFLDVNMPAMELPKCLFSIHEALGEQVAEIIILTGFRLKDLHNFGNLGTMKVITKPDTVDLLAEKILEVCR